jgi:hypothetical protein
VTLVRTIEIDDEVFERLKDEAEPFVDTPNSVLRRLLGLGVVGGEPTARSDDIPGQDRANGDSRLKTTRSSRPGKARASRTRKRVPAGSILPEEEYELPLLEALVAAGGSGASKDITEAVGKRLDTRLTDLDREPLKSGGIRWENRIQFVRLKMIERGFMEKDAPRGTWAISEGGRRFLRENVQ